jgi:hypothetical protein
MQEIEMYQKCCLRTNARSTETALQNLTQLVAAMNVASSSTDCGSRSVISPLLLLAEESAPEEEQAAGVVQFPADDLPNHLTSI